MIRSLPHHRSLTALPALVWLCLATQPLHAVIVSYDFDDGTEQGWTNVLTSPLDEPSGMESSSRGDTVLPPLSGSFRILPQISGSFSPTEDSHHDTLMLRSPEFILGPSGSIDLNLGAGAGGAASPGPSFTALAAAAVVPGSTGSGFAGMALRRVSDDAYVLSVRKSASSASWELLTFSNATLNANSLLGIPLTLDFIDNVQGGFGWVGLDDVTINDVIVFVPEPSTFMLLGLGGLGLVIKARRRRAAP